MSAQIALGQASIADGSAATHHDRQAMMRYDAKKKSVGVAYALWFFFGTLGRHGFSLKQNGTAIVMLIIAVVSVPLSFISVGFVGLTLVGICRSSVPSSSAASRASPDVASRTSLVVCGCFRLARHR